MSITVIGFDYGTRSIGVAVGQDVTCSAQPLQALRSDRRKPDWNTLDRLIREWRPDRLVVGHPLNMDGTSQPITVMAEKFAADLSRRYRLPCILRDERLTTASARELLFASGGYRALEKGRVDSVSAVLITEAYLQDPRDTSETAPAPKDDRKTRPDRG